MQTRKLGSLDVSAIGLGCMGMTPIYGTPDPDLAIRTIHRAAELGITLIDTSDAYGKGTNEQLVGRAIAGRRDRYVVSTKFGNLRMPDGSAGVNGRPEYVVKACDASLKRLGIDMIDLYFQHRVDTDGAGRGHGRRHEPPGRAGQGAPHRPVGSRRARASAAPTRRSRSPRCRPSIARRPARSRPRSSTPAGSSASASSPTGRSAAAS